MPDGRPSGSEPVQVNNLRPPEIPRQCGGADDEPSYPREPAHLVLAGDRPNQALGQLEHLHAWEITRAGMGNLIEIQALRALAAGGKHTAALAALAEALTLAHPQGYFRILAYEGAPMAVLLPVFDTTHAEPHPGKGDASATPVMIAPLTARELEVLAGTVGRRPVKPADRHRTSGHPRHGQKACWPHP